MDVQGQPGGILIAAPHGGFDAKTELIARRVAERLHAGYLVATGYRTHRHQWNVNRPSVGADLPDAAEGWSPKAQAVYDVFAAHVQQQHPRLYVEIHGNDRQANRHTIEVATKSLTMAEARHLRQAYHNAVLRLDRNVPHLSIRIEPHDSIYFTAAATKRHGTLSLVERALHVELPAKVRFDRRNREAYVSVLAQLIATLDHLRP